MSGLAAAGTLAGLALFRAAPLRFADEAFLPGDSPAAIVQATQVAGTEDSRPGVQVRALVQDVHGLPVPDAVVEIWADGRGCVDRSDGNYGMRGDVIEPPPGMVVWRSAVGNTGRDGVARLHVPVGMMTHV
ncbi:MAG TPA: hypothetical protein VIG06_08980, partial [Kofleriaceae bacterium]